MDKIGNRRGSFINYRKPGIFMLTLNKHEEIPYFSKIIRNQLEPDPFKSIRPDYSPLGYVIFNTLRNFREINPAIHIRQYVIMPDHLHIITQITEQLEQPLGNYISIFKKVINKSAIEKSILKEPGTVFERGFNDQFLTGGRNLDTLYQYIKKNPYWWWRRWENPEYFRRINEMVIGDYNCSLYGNPALLEEPFIYPVVVHRADVATGVLEKKMEIYDYAIANGGVLVGYFISEYEKQIFQKAYEEQGKVIKLSDRNFASRQKPTGRDLEMCDYGNMLEITPDLDKYLGSDRTFRQQCLFMNSFAEEISKGVNLNSLAN